MQLTDNEELELRYMQALGYKWIARDMNREVFAHNGEPYRSGIDWVNNGDYECMTLGKYDFLKWEDEPMEIDKLLRENGKDVELVYPKDIED